MLTSWQKLKTLSHFIDTAMKQIVVITIKNILIHITDISHDLYHSAYFILKISVTEIPPFVRFQGFGIPQCMLAPQHSLPSLQAFKQYFSLTYRRSCGTPTICVQPTNTHLHISHVTLQYSSALWPDCEPPGSCQLPSGFPIDFTCGNRSGICQSQMFLLEDP